MLDRDSRELIDNVMSNFDGVIDKVIEKRLREENTYSGYPAWNFHGTVWFDEGKFHCDIRIYGSLVNTISADTLEEIMEEASNKYGWD